MLYLFQSDIIYKDRKKKLTFKENFTIPFKELEDTLDVEILFLKNSDFGRYIEKKTEFQAKGTITLNYQFGKTIRHYVDVSIYLDFTQKYRKI